MTAPETVNNDRGLSALGIGGAAGVVLIFAGMLLAHYIPAPGADWPAERLQEFYQSHTVLKRLGIYLMLFGLTLFGALTAGMSVVLGRIQGARTLAIFQGVIGAAGTVLLMLFPMIAAVAAFRPDRSAEITQALHEVAWYMAFISAAPFVLQSATIAVAVLSGHQALLPRWFGYLNLTVAVLLLPGAALLFFKTGPLAYHGLLSYWIPLVDFGVWMLAMAWAIRRTAVTSTQS